MRVVVLAAVIAGLGAPGTADACVILPNREHVPVVDPADVTPPGPVTVLDLRVHRNPESEEGCGGGAATSCDGIGSIQIALEATDDVTPSEELGFRITVIAGDAPGEVLASPDVVADRGRVHFLFDASADLDFEIGIQAIDRSGNLGPIATLRVADAAGGCSTTPGAPSPASVVLALATLASITRRRSPI